MKKIEIFAFFMTVITSVMTFINIHVSTIFLMPCIVAQVVTYSNTKKIGYAFNAIIWSIPLGLAIFYMWK